LVVEDSLRYSGGTPPDLWRLSSSLSLPSTRKANAILVQDSSARVRRRVTSSVAAERRNRPVTPSDRSTRRAARAEAAVINQWLFEQIHHEPKLKPQTA
jgi:hypothetical protein